MKLSILTSRFCSDGQTCLRRDCLLRLYTFGLSHEPVLHEKSFSTYFAFGRSWLYCRAAVRFSRAAPVYIGLRDAEALSQTCLAALAFPILATFLAIFVEGP